MLPGEYSILSHEDRIDHWLAMLYRAMRWCGEDGLDEMQVFTPELLNRLRSDEAAIEGLLPEVLARLALMQMQDPPAFVANATHRMGLA